MKPVKELFRKFQTSDGRIRGLTATGVLGLVAALALLGVIPALAGVGDPEGDPSAAGVQPVLVEYGGGSGACAEFADAEVAYELHINNPMSQTYEGPDGTKVKLTVTGGDKFVEYEFLGPDGTSSTATMAAFDVIINGGSQNTFYDNDGLLRPLKTDSQLHAPTKGGTVYKLSHINICYDVKPIIDLSVTKSLKAVNGQAPGSEINPGDDLDFEIKVTNNGNTDATGVTVTDTLPDQLTFASASPNAAQSGQTLTWSIAVDAGQTETLSLKASVNEDIASEVTNFSNPVNVSHPDDENTGDNSATSEPKVTLNRTEADLSVMKSSGDTTVVSVGDDVTFTITVENSDSSTFKAESVTVTDTLPVGMDFKSASDSGQYTAPGEGDQDNGTVTWNLGDLTVSADKSLTLVVTINSDAAGIQELTNLVTVTSDTFDPNESNNGDSNNTDDSTVSVNGVISGTVFVDENANSAFDEGETPESLTVTVYDSDDAFADSTTSSSEDGSYSFDLPPGDYTVCLEARAGFEQTVPDLPDEGNGVPCSGFAGTHELVGYFVELSTVSTGNDFGNLPILDCDFLDEIGDGTGTFPYASFEIFSNSLVDCGSKGFNFFIDNMGGEYGPFVGLLLDGSGEAAGRLDITKSFSSPDLFVALRYGVDEDDTPVSLEWCNTRDFDTDDSDGMVDSTQFNDVLPPNQDADPSNDIYPTVVGVDNPFGSGDPVACRVAEVEDLLGQQVTVIYVQTIDPRFY